MPIFYRPTLESEVSPTVTQQPMYWVRKPLAQRQKVKTSQLPASVLEAFEQIEQGDCNRYYWALESPQDALSLLSLSVQPYYRSYPKPARIEELEMNYLLELFPENCTQFVEVTGEYLCPHPYLGPGPAAGSMRCERPSAIPRASWPGACGFGRRGVCLVKADSTRVVLTEELRAQ